MTYCIFKVCDKHIAKDKCFNLRSVVRLQTPRVSLHVKFNSVNKQLILNVMIDHIIHEDAFWTLVLILY